MTVTLGELAVRFGCELRGDPSVDGGLRRRAVAGRSARGQLPRQSRNTSRSSRSTRAGAVILDAKSAAASPVPVAGRRQSARHLRARRHAAASRSAAAARHACHGERRRRCRDRSVAQDRRAGRSSARARASARAASSVPARVIERGAVHRRRHAPIGARVRRPSRGVRARAASCSPARSSVATVSATRPRKAPGSRCRRSAACMHRRRRRDRRQHHHRPRRARRHRHRRRREARQPHHDRATTCRIGAHSALAAVVGHRRQQRASASAASSAARSASPATSPCAMTSWCSDTSFISHSITQAGRVFFGASERGGGHLAAHRRAHQAPRFDGQAPARGREARRAHALADRILPRTN